jgi:glycosyltransferase involved in cell wall biosynthesis
LLHAIPTLGGGGAERQLTYLAAEQVRSGHEVHVAVLCRRGPNFERLLRSGARIHELGRKHGYDPRLGPDLVHLLRAVRPDLLQSWLLPASLWGGACARLLSTPWVVCSRASQSHTYAKAHFQARLFDVCTRLADAVISNSATGHRYWTERLPQRVRTYFIPNALPLDEIDAAPPAHVPWIRERPLVLWIGRFEERSKNIYHQTDALLTVAARTDAVIMMCGSGPEQQPIVDKIASAGLQERVRVVEHRDDVWSLMKVASVLLSASYSEGNPNVVLEAMACRCPVVVSDIGAHRELLDDSTALFAAPTDIAALASAIISSLADPSSAAARAARARPVIERRALPTIEKAYDAAYLAILGDRGDF